MQRPELERGTKASCQCPECQVACQYKPGWFLPGEAERVAQYLHMSLGELFDTRLGVDWWEEAEDIEAAEENIFVLSPAIRRMAPGQEFPGDPRGQCVFYRDGLCGIHAVKPFECRESLHGQDSGDHHRQVAEAWTQHQAQPEALLGRTPHANEW